MLMQLSSLGTNTAVVTKNMQISIIRTITQKSLALHSLVFTEPFTLRRILLRRS
jgi:hypothetical protein